MNNLSDTLDSVFDARAERFVGIFDVLGFKDFVSKTSLDDVRAAYHQLLVNAKDGTDLPIFKIYHDRPPEVERETVPFHVFSDTILIWQHGSGGEHLQNFFQAAALLIASSVEIQLPLRGGISYGECIMDERNNIFLGQPLIDAHETESAQEWIGAAYHKSVLSSPYGENFVKFGRDQICEYKAPLKRCAKVDLSGYVSWWHGYASPNVIDDLMMLRSRSTRRNVRKKFDNTIEFYRQVPRDSV
jgi:hypothetical protein